MLFYKRNAIFYVSHDDILAPEVMQRMTAPLKINIRLAPAWQYPPQFIKSTDTYPATPEEGIGWTLPIQI